MSRRKEIRNCLIGLEDGLSGTGKILDSVIAAGDTTILIDETLNVLTNSLQLVPVGARFTTPGISTIRAITARNANKQVQIVIGADTVGTYTITVDGITTAAINGTDAAAAVQAALEALSNIAAGDVTVTGTGAVATPFDIEFKGVFADKAPVVSATPTALDNFAFSVLHAGAKTWNLTFTPALVAGSLPTDAQVITYLPQRILMKVGTGNFEHTENNEPIFDTDRDALDGVRSGPEIPMEVNTSFVYNFLRSSSGQPTTIYEALHRVGTASDWVNTASDPCEPYAPTLFVIDLPPCGTEQAEVLLFPQFYPNTKRCSIRDAVVELVGKCNAIKPTTTRQTLDAAVLNAEFGL